MGRRGRDLTGKSAKYSPSNGNTVAAAIQEAELLQRKAERKTGQEAASRLEKAVAQYRGVLSRQQELSAEQDSHARFGLAECLQKAAEASLQSGSTADDAVLQSAEAAAHSTACTLFQEAADLYEQVAAAGAPNGPATADALVNRGNALAALAELAEGACDRIRVLEAAAVMYRAALNLEQDAPTHSNLGDALVSVAEALFESSQMETSRQTYAQAFASYSQACSLSTSDDDDDLPGLLHNWGVGLNSAGSSFKDLATLDEAVEKLKSASSFARSDMVIVNALGDALSARAQLMSNIDRLSGLQQAIAEGYSIALAVDRNQPDALVGCAEVEYQIGLLLWDTEAQEHFRASARHYLLALQQPTRLGGFAERSDVRFNYACAACRSGDLQAAESILRKLLAAGGVKPADILNDADLQGLQGSTLWPILEQHTRSPH